MNEKEVFAGRFRSVHMKFSKLYPVLLSEARLTLPQYALLVELLNSDSLPMTEVSSRLFITKPAVTHLVDRLEKSRMLKRLPHPKDRRVSLIEILPKGREVVQKTQSQVLNIFFRAFEQFTPRERKLVIRFYELLGQSVSEKLSYDGKVLK